MQPRPQPGITSANCSKMPLLVVLSLFRIRSEGKTPETYRIYIKFGALTYNLNTLRFQHQQFYVCHARII